MGNVLEQNKGRDLYISIIQTPVLSGKTNSSTRTTLTYVWYIYTHTAGRTYLGPE